VTVDAKGRRGRVGASKLSDRDLPLGRATGVAGLGVLRDSFEVDVSADSAAPVKTSPAGGDVVFGPVDVEFFDDAGVEDAAELPVFALTVEDFVDGDGLADSAELASDDELDGSAQANPWLANRTAPTPSATARPPIRPRYALQRTGQLYRQR
jgi:hypothetical protein